MITISKATRDDLPAIRHLSAKYGHKLMVEEYHLNNKDVALQARLDSDGSLLGFVWAGLMAKGRIAYVDKVMVDPLFSGHREVLPRLYKELFSTCLKRGVKEAFGFIRQDKYHDKSAKAALHMAWGGESISYTHVFANLKNMELELKNLGVI